MHTPRTSQLEWIHKNRQPRSRAAPVGEVLGALLKPDFDEEVRHRTDVLRAVSEVVDDAFREACTLGPTNRRGITILVEHPAMLYALRLGWCFLLVEHLDRRCRFLQTPKVRFRLGRSPDVFVKHEQFPD